MPGLIPFSRNVVAEARWVLVPLLLRHVRRQAGLSVRAAADRCDIPRATWAGWEAGTTSPTLRRLDEVLRCFCLELEPGQRRVEPPGEDRVRGFLCSSLTKRARHALGDQLEPVLAACREQPRVLTGPAAVGVWVPFVFARGPLPLPRDRGGSGPVRLRLDLGKAPERPAYAAVATPGALVAAGAADRYPALLTSARLLDEQGPRDLAERRLPAHRDPDELREMRDLWHTLTWGALSYRPVDETDSRAWRLGAAASLNEHLQSQRLPPRHKPPDGWAG